ncbi:single-stranded-DNA-specific exonuclease [Deinobacterium chartae]|uniref:Single-stranded-DNA-specific exonuclease RecJ n=1 Tax=Deinobacterium chartae TaxID=521158 RepID=A0A841HXV5_9DEIO|nr:single-stranded-DNA-specific exonuclease RecJ [Deinobacterium chartae]MBB6097726.1 single-stranded-DNA-specific exonuclease [Deinobacterium chartae]
MKASNWTLARPASRAELLEIMERLRVSPMLAQVIHGRALDPGLLSAELTLTPNPALPEAARRLVAAIRAKKRIRIHGDYDADGITAASVLLLGLRELGADVHAFIPHRLEEGYGIHPDKVPEHIEACELLLTVDCGVSNLEEVRRMVEAGLEVIVTDHHHPGEEVPGCLIVHPQLTPGYVEGQPALTGSGVAYHLLWAVHNELGLPAPLHYADLAAIGAIADVAPLLGENRALVVAGLEQMRNSRHAGIRASLKMQNLKAPTARDVAFILAPRINAAGRLGEAEVALEFLTTASERRAQELATYLDVRNLERREIQERMYQQALELVNPNDPAIVVTHEDWHAGIMGIVASKLLEKFYKPVFIIAQGKGSVRSTPGISAVEGLNFSRDLLKRYGGHSGAAGFAILEENIPALQERLHKYALRFPVPVPQVRLDALLPAGAYTASFYREVCSLEPYGEGHRPPLWWVDGILEEGRQIGKEGATYQFSLGGVRGVRWRAQGPRAGTAVDAAVNLSENAWNGRVKYEYLAEDLRPATPLRLEGVEDGAFTPLPRLSAQQALGALKENPQRWAVYAEGEGRSYLERAHPAVRLLEPGESASSVLLMALPPEEDLRRWLQGAEVAFAWGEKTLQALERPYAWNLEGLRLGDLEPRILEELGIRSHLELDHVDLWSSPTVREQAAEAYLRTCWARMYRRLDDASFAVAARALAGLAASPVLAGAADD